MTNDKPNDKQKRKIQDPHDEGEIVCWLVA